jgi:pimeloyl-ACP methyl ester carboxylesterase
MVGGFTSFLPQHADLFLRPLTIPSAHVIGRSDGIVPRSDSLELAGRFTDPLVLEHGGGHIIPADREVAEPIARFRPGSPAPRGLTRRTKESEAGSEQPEQSGSRGPP